MRSIALALTAAVLLPANTSAQTAGSGDSTLCTLMIDQTANRLPEAGSSGTMDLTEAQVAAIKTALDAARSLETKDHNACLTMVNAARTILAQGSAVIPSDAVAVVDLQTWEYDPLYANTWRAEALMDETVYSEAGEEIGEVHDILMRPDGTITGIVVEGGGMLDIGDSHVRVAWEDVRFRNGTAMGVVVPIKEGELTDYSFFDGANRGVPDLNEGEFRMSRLIDEPVRLSEGTAYGYIDDVLVQQGKVKATVMRPDVAYRGRPEPMATPYYPYGYGYGSYGFYVVPYDSEQLADLPAFDAERIEGPSEASEPEKGAG